MPMRRALLLACLLFPPGAIPAGVSLNVFYCIYEERKCVSSDNPVSMERTDFLQLATMVLTGSKKNFIGFVDKSNTTLQFYLDRPDMVHVEIPVASRRGSLASDISLRRAQDIIASLSPPLSTYESKLDLKFQKW